MKFRSLEAWILMIHTYFMQKFGGQQQKKFQVEIHSLPIRQTFCSSFPFRNTSKLLPVWKLLIEWMYHMLKLKYLHGCTFNKSIIFKYVEQNLPLGLSKSNNNFQVLPTNLAESLCQNVLVWNLKNQSYKINGFQFRQVWVLAKY